MSGAKIELDSLVVGMVNVSKTAVVGCMNRSVHCFHIKGKKLWSMYMPGACRVRVRLLLHPTSLYCAPTPLQLAYVAHLARAQTTLCAWRRWKWPW